MEVLAHISARATKDDDKKAIAQRNSYMNFTPAHRVTIKGRISKASIQRSSRAKNHSGIMKVNPDRTSPKTSLQRLELAHKRWSAEHAQKMDSKATRKKEIRDHSDAPRLCSNTQSGWLALSASFATEALDNQTYEANDDVDRDLEIDNVTMLDVSDKAQTSIAIVIDDPESDDSTQISVSNVSSRSNSPLNTPEVSTQHQVDKDSLGRSPVQSQNSLAISTSLSSMSTCIKSPAPFEELMRIEGTGTFMSRYLQRLISRQDLNRYYQPHTQGRKPIDSERGYWRFSMGLWDHPKQLEFWTFLSGVVGKGRAGIGTECVRGLDEDLGGNKSPSGIIRVYCWGELIMPIYLVCYIGCGGLLKDEKACWISAIDGQTLIQIN